MLRSFDRRRSLMWAVALAALGAFAWIVSAANVAGASSGGIAGYSGNPATSGGATTSTAATSASAIYSSMCADCHGANGQGGDGPSLQVSTMSTSELQWIIANGVGGMPYYSRSLSSSEISGLASFTRGMQIPGATTSSPPTGGAGPSLKTSTMSTSAINTIVANGSGGMPGYSSILNADQISAVSSHTAGLQDPGANTDDPGAAAAYASQCAGCHGADGEGGFGPSLQALDASAAEIESVIADGYNGMSGFSDSLTTEQITELAAYSVSLQAGATGGAVNGEGSMLYDTHCAACHGASGEGGIGPALVGTSLSAGDTASAVQSDSGAMHSIASALSADDLATVAEFILTLEADTADSGDPAGADPTAAIYSSMCAGCHGDGGQGASAPALIRTALDTAGLVSIIADGQNGMPGYAGQLSSTEIEDLAGLILALGQSHGDASDTTGAPATTRAVVTARPQPEESDEDGGIAARILGIILLSWVLGSGTYLGFASRATRREQVSGQGSSSESSAVGGGDHSE